MNTHVTGEQLIAAARQREVEARALADQAARDYRRTVAQVVAEWKTQGLSKRRAAQRIGITESALRELLRPEGQTRSTSRARRRPVK
jgi:transposase